MKKKILILGGSGFLGKNLLVKLVRSRKYKITSISNKTLKNSKKLKKISYISCNINNYQKLIKKLKNKKFDFVINFSGNIDHSDKKETFKAHFNGVKNIVKYIKLTKSGLLIQTGSSLEYGENKSPQNEKQICKPLSVYGEAKLLSSKFIIKNLNDFIILRPYQIYGPYQKKNRLIPIIIDSCMKDLKFPCTQGNQKRDFLYVDDFIDLIIKILGSKKINSGIFNVGSGKPIKVKKAILTIVKKIKKGIPMFGKLKMRKDEKNSLYPNLNKTKKTFKWRPKINFKTGISKTINFYKKK